MDVSGPRLPIGRSGRLEALHLTTADADHAFLVLDSGQPRALVSAAAEDGAAERLVLTGIGGPVDTSTDADALAGWLGRAPLAPAREPVPVWANLTGFVLLLVLAAFMVIGGAVAFGWLLEAIGG